MSDPAISVIIPTRDRAALLPGVLDALRAQVCATTFEVVVVDNASTDGTGALLADRCADDQRFRALRQSVLGRSAAMNTGAAAARGDLLVFTDDDVVVAPDWLESYRKFFASRAGVAPVVAGGPIHPVAEHLGPWPAWLGDAAIDDLVPLDWGGAERELHPPEYLWGANMALTRVVFDRIGTWDETVGRRGDERGTYEDVEYQDRIRRAGGAVWYCPSARVLHRLPADRVTPAIVLSNAFARGRNEVWSEAARPRPAGIGVVAIARFGRWAVRTLSFRISGGADRFDRARRAAVACGDAMELSAQRYGDVRGAGAMAAVGWIVARAIVRAAGRRQDGPRPSLR